MVRCSMKKKKWGLISSTQSFLSPSLLIIRPSKSASASWEAISSVSGMNLL